MTDERPKPKYGELAPEGWKWKPPAPPAGSAAPTVPGGLTPPAPSGVAQPWSASAASSLSPSQLRPVNIVDVTVTSVLLFLGVLVSASMIPALFDFSTVLSQAAAMQGYGTFTPSTAANSAGTAAGIATIVLQLVAIGLSVRRLSRRKLAFPIPIIFGLVTTVIWLVVISYAFFNDPAFVESVLTTPPAT